MNLNSKFIKTSYTGVYKLYTVHCVYSVQCSLCIQCTVYIVHTVYKQYIVQCTLYTGTVYTVQAISLQSSMYSVKQCQLYNLSYCNYSVQCSLNTALYNVQCTLYNVQCTLYNVNCTV